MLKRRSVPFFVTRPKVVHADPVRMPGVTNPVESTLDETEQVGTCTSVMMPFFQRNQPLITNE
jgi:hypothetical protein